MAAVFSKVFFVWSDPNLKLNMSKTKENQKWKCLQIVYDERIRRLA